MGKGKVFEVIASVGGLLIGIPALTLVLPFWIYGEGTGSVVSIFWLMTPAIGLTFGVKILANKIPPFVVGELPQFSTLSAEATRQNVDGMIESAQKLVARLGCNIKYWTFTEVVSLASYATMFILVEGEVIYLSMPSIFFTMLTLGILLTFITSRICGFSKRSLWSFFVSPAIGAVVGLAVIFTYGLVEYIIYDVVCYCVLVLLVVFSTWMYRKKLVRMAIARELSDCQLAISQDSRAADMAFRLAMKD